MPEDVVETMMPYLSCCAFNLYIERGQYDPALQSRAMPAAGCAQGTIIIGTIF